METIQKLFRLGGVLFVAAAGLLSARPAFALPIEHTYWYSDATFTQLVGEEINNPCTGDVWYWGQMTNYYRETVTRCTP